MTVDPRLVVALADRYRIERELGQGGMATVYLAEDLKHHRKVAVKVLKPELAVLLGAERFLREIELVAGLHHPHILPLYDSGEVRLEGGTAALYYVMPLVEGESLRAKIDREGQLPLDDALRYAREVADALSYAHVRGIVHRDIKPDNIMIESGHAVVADFGIAKAVANAGDATALTGTGMSIGTPAYMSPEQAAGDREVDGRSDLYSLGCVLYEMLAGQPPFGGKTVEVLVRQHIMTPPPPVTQFRPAVPAVVADALARSLAKSPADRFNPVGQFADALSQRPPAAAPQERAKPRRGWIAGAVGAVILMAVAGWLIQRGGDGTSETNAPSIAVLPFDLLAADSSDAAFILGMHGEIVTQLGKLPGLQVASRSSSLQYRGSTKPEREIAGDLGVANLLTGSLQRSGGQVRVTVALSDARNGRQLWAESYDRELTAENLFAIQGDIAGQVAGALRVRLSEEQQAELAQAPTSNLAALDFYHRALALWDARGLFMSDSGLLDFVGRAVMLDSQFVAAWGLLSQAESWLVRTGRQLDTVPARQALDRVHALAPGSLEDRLAAGYFAYYARGDYAGALRDIEAAERLLPNTTEISVLKALLLRRLGRWAESVAVLNETLARDPRSLLALNDLAVSYTYLRRNEEAEQTFAKGLAISPANSSVIFRRFLVLLQGLGDSAKARELVESSGPVLTTQIRGASQGMLAMIRRQFPQAVQSFLSMGTLELAGEFEDPKLSIALASYYGGDRQSAIGWADTVIREATIARRKRERPGVSDPFAHLAKVQLKAALAEAITGNSTVAIAQGERAVAMMPLSRDAVEAPSMLQQLAGVYILAGRHDKALDLLEQLLTIPSMVSPGLLQFDPLYDPLRSNPRFQALLAGGGRR